MGAFYVYVLQASVFAGAAFVQADSWWLVVTRLASTVEEGMEEGMGAPGQHGGRRHGGRRHGGRRHGASQQRWAHEGPRLGLIGAARGGANCKG